MANYYTEYSFEIESITPEEEAWITMRLGWDYDVEYPTIYTPCTLHGSEDSRYLWIHDDTGGSEIEVLTELLQDFLTKFRADQHITFSWAHTCSKPRFNSFGGGAVFITSKEIRWMSTGDWMAEQRREHGDLS